MRKVLVFLIFVLGGMGSASAQEVSLDDPAWALYQAAFARCAEGALEVCQERLEELLREHPSHPAAALGRASLEELRGLLARQEEPGRGRRGRNGERFTALAKAEIISGQTLHGVVIGGELCLATDCGEKALVTSLMLGGGAGLGLSWYLTRDGITPGLALSLDSGAIWGGVQAGLWNAAGDTEDETLGLTLILGQAVGMGLGGAYYYALEPTAGQVSLTNSGGMWSLASFFLLQGIVDEDVSDGALFGGAALSSLGGLAVGGALGRYVPMSRSRVALIDTGGLVGGLAGGGIAVLSGVDDQRPAFALVQLGVLSGLGLSAWLTEGWDEGDEDVRRKKEALGAKLSLVPAAALDPSDPRRPGWGLQLSGGW
jgi:hypothetical protein